MFRKLLQLLLAFVFPFFSVGTIASPLGNPDIPVPTRTPARIEKQTALGGAIVKSLAGTKGKYGILVRHLTTHEDYSINEHTSFATGSLYKLWVMVAVYNEIQRGKFTEDQIITGDIASLNKEFFIDSEVAEQKEGTISYSVKDAIEKMIMISDNYAALLLTDKVTLPAIETFLDKNNLRESALGKNGDLPKTTAHDVAEFFEKLYNGELADSVQTEKMLSILKKQALNEKLPKFLPQGIPVAHKTGELDAVSHDAGIVYTPKGDYILVVLTQSDAPELANERISAVSQAVYNYFSR